MTAASSNIEELVKAIKFSDLDAAKSLLAQGVDPNEEDKYGKPPLIYATNKNDVAMVELLLDAGADINQTYSTGITPLISAAERSLTVLPLLIERGARLDQKDNLGYTALDWAKKFCHTDTRDQATKILLKAQEKQAELADPHNTAMKRQASIKNLRPNVRLKP